MGSICTWHGGTKEVPCSCDHNGADKFPIKDCWLHLGPWQLSPFSSIMSRNRFSLLLRFLHLNDSTKYILNGEPGYDPLYKLRLSVDPFIVNFKAAFNLGHEIAVDEGMISFKGRLWFLQYMPKKTQPSEGWRHLYCQIALQDIPTIRNCIQVRTKISIWQTIPPLKMYVYFTHRKGLHTRWHEWCYTWSSWS